MLAQTNPLAHSELIFVGTLHNVAPGPLLVLEAREGGNGRLGTALFPIIGTVVNSSETDPITINFEESTLKASGYTTLQLFTNGALANTLVVPPRGYAQFALNAVTKAFIRASYAGKGFGRIGLHSFVGRLIRHEV